jgi:hypothetical protein
VAGRVIGVVYAVAFVVLVARGQASGAVVSCAGCCGCGLSFNLQGDRIMEDIDLYMITAIIAVAIVAVFFGMMEHLETMAGCLK